MIQTLFGNTEKKAGLFERMKEAVSRTRENLSERIEEVVAFDREIDRNTLDDLEGGRRTPRRWNGLRASLKLSWLWE